MGAAGIDSVRPGRRRTTRRTRGVPGGTGTTARGPIVVSATAVALTVALIPIDTHQLSATVSFVPAVLSVVACFDLLSMYLLVGDYRDNGDLRILTMAAAYLWSLVLMAGYAFAFPGVFSAHPPLALTPSVAPWFYVGWHAGFPTLLGAAWAPWPGRSGPTERGRRTFTARLSLGVVATAAAAAVAGGAVFADRLPVVIHGHDTLRLAQLTAPVVLPLVAVALLASWTGTRGRTGPERWTAVAVLACLCDLVLTYSSRYRFSLGWYAGRAMTVTAAGVVLFAMLVGFRRLKSRAQFDASYDALTRLANRRYTLDAAGLMFAGARRSGAPLGVVLLDLDLFKQVNDRYGHAAGDELLTAVGAALTASARTSDLIGRIGGEEFLAVLPNTDLQGCAVVAERLRGAVAALEVPAAGAGFTASLGAACLDSDDDLAALLRRADEALYRAKDAGRNRVVTGARVTDPGDPAGKTGPAAAPVAAG